MSLSFRVRQRIRDNHERKANHKKRYLAYAGIMKAMKSRRNTVDHHLPSPQTLLSAKHYI